MYLVIVSEENERLVMFIGRDGGSSDGLYGVCFNEFVFRFIGVSRCRR